MSSDRVTTTTYPGCTCCTDPTCAGCDWRHSPYGIRICSATRGNYYPFVGKEFVGVGSPTTLSWTVTMDSPDFTHLDGNTFTVSVDLEGSFDDVAIIPCGLVQSRCGELAFYYEEFENNVTEESGSTRPAGYPILKLGSWGFSAGQYRYRKDSDGAGTFPNVYSQSQSVLEWESTMLLPGSGGFSAGVDATFYAKFQLDLIGLSGWIGHPVTVEVNFNVHYIWYSVSPPGDFGYFPTDASSEYTDDDNLLCPAFLISLINVSTGAQSPHLTSTDSSAQSANVTFGHPEYAFDVREIAFPNWADMPGIPFHNVSPPTAQVNFIVPENVGIDECAICYRLTFPSPLSGYTEFTLCRCGRDAIFRRVSAEAHGASYPGSMVRIRNNYWAVTFGAGTSYLINATSEGSGCCPTSLTFISGALEGTTVTVTPISSTGYDIPACDDCAFLACNCFQLDVDVTFEDIQCSGTFKIAVNDDDPSYNYPTTINVDVYKNGYLEWSGVINTTTNAWQDTGVSFSSGDEIRIVSSDEYETGTGITVDAGGYVDGPFYPPTFDELPCPNGLPWSLMGKIE